MTSVKCESTLCWTAAAILMLKFIPTVAIQNELQIESQLQSKIEIFFCAATKLQL